MSFRTRSCCAVLALLFCSFLSAQTTLTITSAPATLTLGSDTIVFSGNTVPLVTTISPNTSTPLATEPVTVTASPLTAGGPSGFSGFSFLRGFVSQTFTVNGVSATVNRLVEVDVNTFAGSCAPVSTPCHSYQITSFPATFNLPQGSLTFSGDNFVGPVPAPGTLTVTGNSDSWFLIPKPAAPNTFNIYNDFPMSTLGGLVG